MAFPYMMQAMRIYSMQRYPIADNLDGCVFQSSADIMPRWSLQILCSCRCAINLKLPVTTASVEKRTLLPLTAPAHPAVQMRASKC